MSALRPRLLDLFCKAGGATRGYQLAGFHVTGVDIEPQPNYCGDEFVQADALEFELGGFDAIHASPVCLRYANVTKWRGDPEDHPDQIPLTRERLVAAGVPWVIENVPGAPMAAHLVLCGSMFGLPVRRHRWFEFSEPAAFLVPRCSHRPTDLPFMHKGERAFADAMGCHWMSNREARQAIPPAYTEFIGRHLLGALQPVEAAS